MTEEAEEKPKSKRGGCMPLLLLVGGSAMAGGVYLMGRWDSINGSGKAGAVVLLVLGTIVLLPVVLFFVVTVVVKHFVNKFVKEISGATKGMFDLNKAMYGSVHEFRPATPDDFEDLDQRYYDTTKATLAELGYRHLGDVVDKTIESISDVTVPIRVFSSPDGTTQVGIFDMSGAGNEENMFICDVGSEFSDGTFLATSNTENADLMTPPPRIRKRWFPRGTPVLELVQAHETEKQKILAAAPDLKCTACNTLEEALASEQRQQQVKNEFRKEIGYVDPNEVRRIASKVSDDPEVADFTANAVEEQRKREQQEE